MPREPVPSRILLVWQGLRTLVLTWTSQRIATERNDDFFQLLLRRVSFVLARHCALFLAACLFLFARFALEGAPTRRRLRLTLPLFLFLRLLL